MNHTTNYQLNQWELHDRVMMQDFNSDNAKIDAALKIQADALAAEAQARENSVAAETQARMDAAAAEAQARADAMAAEIQARTAADSSEAAAREALAAELRPKAGVQLISSGKVYSNTQAYRIPLTSVDWTQWKAIHLTAVLSGVQTVGIGTSSGNTQGTFSGSHGHIVFYPMFDNEHAAVALQMSTRDFIAFQTLYKNLTELWFVASSSNTIKAGTTYKIWGEK